MWSGIRQILSIAGQLNEVELDRRLAGQSGTSLLNFFFPELGIPVPFSASASFIFNAKRLEQREESYARTTERMGMMEMKRYAMVVALVSTFSLGIGLAFAGKGKPGGGGGSAPPYDPAIAYSSWHCGSGNLFAMNADGSNKTLLLQGGGHPAWLPGGWLLFNHAGMTLQGEGLYVIDSFDPQALANIGDSSGCVEFALVNPADSAMVVWSDPQQLPDGGWTAEIFFGIQGPAGWNTVRVDTFPDVVLPGAWSPDGTRIAALLWDSTDLRSKGGWILELTYDTDGLPAGFVPLLNLTNEMTVQGWDMDQPTDWSGQSDRWLLMSGSQGSNKDDVFLIDLWDPERTFHKLTNNVKVSHRNAKWSPCDDRILVEEVSGGVSESHKLSIYEVSFDGSGNFLGATRLGQLPGGKTEQFFWPDWRPAGPGECNP
ncbi:MAG: hypothetical protein JSU96_03030 [Acidobacteriota bacterium]|nr:MAG: hypothetical protein JSU96_03030 [Acidobacteriota bacterium]